MSDRTCRRVHGAEVFTIGSPITAETSVAEATKRPGAREVLQRFGLNHCCGAHLTLRESAASAGVSVDTVLEALAQASGRQ
jgi:iron-sulfur cluster repair protein YtfE (RIC family)